MLAFWATKLGVLVHHFFGFWLRGLGYYYMYVCILDFFEIY